MVRFAFLALTIATVVGLYLWWLMSRALQRREEIVKLGVSLAGPQAVMKIYRHDRAMVRLVERILSHDRAIPILEDEERSEAERLVKAWYDDKGD